MKCFLLAVAVGLLSSSASFAAETCMIRGVELLSPRNCGLVKRILAGETVPFGPGPAERDDIVLVCEKALGGFMDERALVPETRERHFQTLDMFDCFKKMNGNGEKQGKWFPGARDLGGKPYRARHMPGM